MKKMSKTVKNPTSDVEQTIFDVMKPTHELVHKNERYNHLTKMINYRIDSIFEDYLEIGNLLKEVEQDKIYEANEYTSIYEYASKEFDLSETTTKNIISIVKRFCTDHGRLLDQYKEFSFSNLVELLPVDDKEIKNFTPSMTVKTMRSKKIELEVNKQLEKLTSEDSLLTDLINKIVNYDWNKRLKTKDFFMDYTLNKKKYELNNNDDQDYNFRSGKYSIIVDFTLKNDKKKNVYKFKLKIDLNEFRFNIDGDYYIWNTLESLDDLDKSLDEIIKKIIQHDLHKPKEKEVKIKQIYSKFGDLSNYQYRYNDSVKAIIETLKEKYKDYYIKEDYYSFSLYKEAEESKKNQAVFIFSDLQNPINSTISTLTDTGEYVIEPLFKDLPVVMQSLLINDNQKENNSKQEDPIDEKEYEYRMLKHLKKTIKLNVIHLEKDKTEMTKKQFITEYNSLVSTIDQFFKDIEEEKNT